MLSEEPLLTLCVRGNMLPKRCECFKETYSVENGKARVGLIYYAPLYILGYILDDIPSLNSLFNGSEEKK